MQGVDWESKKELLKLHSAAASFTVSKQVLSKLGQTVQTQSVSNITLASPKKYHKSKKHKHRSLAK